MNIFVEMAPGELIDKITILEIKKERISEREKLVHVNHEYDILVEVMETEIPQSKELATLKDELKTINEELWQIEDDIRDCEREGDFGDKFVDLARSVYISNDKRALFKKNINMLLDSKIIEEKSYQKY